MTGLFVLNNDFRLFLGGSVTRMMVEKINLNTEELSMHINNDPAVSLPNQTPSVLDAEDLSWQEVRDLGLDAVPPDLLDVEDEAGV